MQDRFGRFLIISTIFHIILFLCLYSVLKNSHFDKPVPVEIELLTMSDIAFHDTSMKGSPDNSFLNRENLMQYDDPIFDSDIIGTGLTSDDNPLTPLEEFSVPISSYKEHYHKKKVSFLLPQGMDIIPPSVEDEFSRIEKEYKEEKKVQEDRDYQIISEDLKGRKLIRTGTPPSGLVFSKNEKVILKFIVKPNGNVENIVPETIISGANLDIAINMLGEFQWEESPDGTNIEAKIIFYFKVR